MTFDSQGRRFEKKVTVAGATTLHHRYIYRGYLQIAALDLTRSAHSALWFVTWDPSQPTATRPLAIQKDGTWFTYGYDLTKTICEVFGPAGYIRTSYSYAPFGSVSESGDVSQPLQWSSEVYDSELDLVYYNYRHYSPSLGRFLSRDPIEEQGGLNLYVFTYNRAVFEDDGLGLAPIPDSNSFWSAYPNYNHYVTSGKVWEKVGGNLYWSYLLGDYFNSCALRISIGLNASEESKIPSGKYTNRAMDFTTTRKETRKFEERKLLNKQNAGLYQDMLRFEENYLNKGKTILKASLTGRFIISANRIGEYFIKSWGEGTAIKTKIELRKYEDCLAGKVAIFSAGGHTGVLRKGYRDPYVEGYLPIVAWKLN